MRAADHLAKQAARENSSHSLKGDEKKTIIMVLKKNESRLSLCGREREESEGCSKKKKEEAEDAGR